MGSRARSATNSRTHQRRGRYADGRLYCLAEDGRRSLLRPQADRETAGQFRLVEEKVNDAWAHPVLLDGRLYLRYHDALWCYDVKDHGAR